MTKIFSAIAIIGLVVGLVSSHPIIMGVGKAIFGVFFILAYLVKMFAWVEAEKPETTHDHGGLMGKGGHGHGHSH